MHTARRTADPITSEDVKKQELEHIRPDHAPDVLVGLSLSGGGIRSACFSLGAIQALEKLKLFKHLDYVSTVSGGGYVGGWLQAALAHGRRRAIELDGEEPREIRFLRAYSNYLTPKLGLFSGDTWAAIGTSLRNLILNFTILSLSLLVPLFLPWLAAALFWYLVPNGSSEWWVLAPAGVLLVVVITASVANTEARVRPANRVRNGASDTDQRTVYATVVVPGLVAIWLVSAAMWARARDVDFDVSAAWALTKWGALFYAGAWVVGLAAAFLWNGRALTKSQRAGALKRACQLVVTAVVAGVLGTFMLGISIHVWAMLAGTTQTWLAGLMSFPIAVLCVLLGATAHIGLAGNAMSDATREWWGRVGGVQLLLSLTLVVASLLSLGGPHLADLLGSQWHWIESHQTTIVGILGAIWAAVTGAGVLAGRSEHTASGRGNPLLELAGKVAPVVFVFGYLLILAALMHRVTPQSTLGASVHTFVSSLCDVEAQMRSAATPPRQPLPSRVAATTARADDWHISCESTAAPRVGLGTLGGLLLLLFASGGLAWAISWQVDLNEFSLHTFYRNRLVRCFLGASRQRKPHPFTGFDDDDDMSFADLMKARDGRIRPYPIFNTAINLVGGKNLAWQERKAASFIFTPEFCGFEYRDDDDPAVERKAAAKRSAEDAAVQQKGDDSGVVTPKSAKAGVRRLSAYARTSDHAREKSSLTLGMAIATSGAAASPNMGYHTSPTLSFLMTVFNVRLGWWLRNPRFHEMWSDMHTGLSLRELVYELLGMTTDDRKWVYLSDGGHFENLGVYELVRRRCGLIIACDAGQDGDVTFEDLGNAIERCRADFGVNIDIDLGNLRPGPDRRAAWHCAIGTIRYDRVPQEGDDANNAPGTLVYIKTSLTGDEPADVLRYAAEHPAFPHESTSDQFFDESQFESYRALGYHAVDEVFGSSLRPEDCDTLSPVEMFTLVRQRWGKAAPAPADAVRKYSAALDRIWTVVRTTKSLNFLDSQMFPEMPALMQLKYPPSDMDRPPSLPINYWLPAEETHRRDGFYVCIQMLQLMEDVFLEFELEEYWDHIDNRGWMNLFQHWAWSGMLCATWAIAGATFDPRFQRFCRIRLDLRPGDASVADTAGSMALPSRKAWLEARQNGSCEHTRQQWQDTCGLNFWEVELVDKYLQGASSDAHSLVPIYVTVSSPRRSDEHPLRFNVGYMIGVYDETGTAKRFSLHYMRIQNHLRKMGVARESLLALKRTHELTVDQPPFDLAVANGKLSDEGLPIGDAIRRLRGIVRSLPR